MSFILDALKKSERERQSSVSAKLNAAPTVAAERSLRVSGQLLLATVLLVGLLIILALVLRPAPAPPEPVTSQTLQSASMNAETPPPPATRSLAGEANSTPARAATASPGAVAEPRQTFAALPNTEALPLLADLSADLRRQIGPMHVDAHAYSVNPEERFVLINLKRLAEGSTTQNGTRVREITPEGVILDYRGQAFFLPRN